MKKLHRRDMIRKSTKLLSAVAVLPWALGHRAQAADACVEPDSESLRDDLLYTDPAPDSNENCGGCGYFTAEENSPCGQCVIMNGPVSKSAHCEAWVPKP